MLEPGKFWLLVFGVTIFGTSLFGLRANGNEPEDHDFLKSKSSATTVEKMHIKVTNQYGRVLVTDFKTPTDNHIDFDLQPLAIGDYIVEVHQGNQIINSTSLRNVSSNPEVLTVEILNSRGKQVYESTNPSETYDLTEMKKGNYTVNVYQGTDLINSRKLKN